MRKVKKHVIGDEKEIKSKPAIIRPIPLLLLVLFISLIVAASVSNSSRNPTPVYGYRIVQTFPHDSKAFTQGLIYDQGFLYESTGLNGSSSLRKTELKTGHVLKQVDLPDIYFAEGLALWGNQLIQLTWRSRKGFVYDRDSFRLLQEFPYPMEGWGLTHDGKQLILSDGTSRLYFLDPSTYKIHRNIHVTDKGKSVTNINELEYINGEVYANIWQTNKIARISPQSGKVISWVDLTGLLPRINMDQPVDVLNGIAYDEKADRLFVTGKLWPRIFEIRLVDPDSGAQQSY